MNILIPLIHAHFRKQKLKYTGTGQKVQWEIWRQNTSGKEAAKGMYHAARMKHPSTSANENHMTPSASGENVTYAKVKARLLKDMTYRDLFTLAPAKTTNSANYLRSAAGKGDRKTAILRTPQDFCWKGAEICAFLTCHIWQGTITVTNSQSNRPMKFIHTQFFSQSGLEQGFKRKDGTPGKSV